MLERLLTTKLSSRILAHLTDRGWSVGRIARQIGASGDYVRRIQSGKQSLQYRDLELLSKAKRQAPHRFVFDAIGPDMLSSEMRGLYESTRTVLDRGDEFRSSLRKSSRKRRSRGKAA